MARLQNLLNLTQEEGAHFLTDLTQRVRRNREELEHRLDESVKVAVQRVGTPLQAEVAAGRDYMLITAGKKAEAAFNDLRASDAGKKAESAIADLRQRESVKKAEESARKVMHDLFSGGDKSGSASSS